MADAPKIIITGLNKDSLRTGAEKINKAIDNANEALASSYSTKGIADNAKLTADEALSNSESTQNQLNTIVINGDSSVEAAQARVRTVRDETKTFTTLTDRLNDTDLQVNSLPNQNLILSTPEQVKIVGHRGLSGVAPENTIPSYVLAGKAGIWGAECDIWRTVDGEWAVIHDQTLDRTTTGTGDVTTLTMAEIKSYNIDGGVNAAYYPNLKVPTLEEYLDVCKQYGMVPIIEVKSANVAVDAPDLVNRLKKKNLEEKAIILTADLLVHWEIRKYSKKLPLQYLAAINDTSLTHVKNMGNASINEEYSTLTKAKIEQAHSMGIAVNTWTVNSYEKARELIGFGVDMLSTDVIVEVKG